MTSACRYELDTGRPVPPVAQQAFGVLLQPPGDATATAEQLRPLLGSPWAERVAADWLALVEGAGALRPGAAHVVVSQGVVSANLDVDGRQGPLGRLRVVVGPDGEVREAAVLRPWSR